jgi:ABC-type sulfate/molybdate transport systems ATPase subunit
MLSVEGIGRKKGNDFILREISFVQAADQHLAIAGETGSGKSTLLKIIAGLSQPDEGRVLFEEKRVLGPDEQLIAGHPHIGFLSQHFELRNNYWVHEILEYANKLTESEAAEIFHVCQIDHLLGRRTNELSGGEKQRIATARLLVNSPKLLLLDEPYSNLDMIHKQTMKQVIHNISEKLGISTILVSHEPADILPWADQLILLKDGCMVQQGTPEFVYSNPVDEYAAGLLGKYFLMPSSLALAMGAPDPKLFENGTTIVRPGDIRISLDETGVVARVSNKLFLGSCYEYRVSIGDLHLSFYHENDLPAAGTEVKLKLI